MKKNKVLACLSLLVLIVALTGVVPASAASGVVTQIPISGTGSPVTGDFAPSGGDGTQLEFPASEEEDAPEAYNGIVDRSFSSHTSHGVSANSGKKAKSNPTFNKGFEGLNLFQQRYARGGNQFTVEPPDQGLCAGNGYVLEAVNDVLNVFNTSG